MDEAKSEAEVASGSVRLAGRRNVPRIGSRKGLSLAACKKAVCAPFDELLTTFLDFLYSDARIAGVTGQRHAKVLFRRWLELSIAHDRDKGGKFVPYLTALVPFYPTPAILRADRLVQEPLLRKDAETAMRAPFEDILARYFQQLYNPERTPGVRDEAHARATFITFCGCVLKYRIHNRMGVKEAR